MKNTLRIFIGASRTADRNAGFKDERFLLVRSRGIGGIFPQQAASVYTEALLAITTSGIT